MVAFQRVIHFAEQRRISSGMPRIPSIPTREAGWPRDRTVDCFSSGSAACGSYEPMNPKDAYRAEKGAPTSVRTCDVLPFGGDFDGRPEAENPPQGRTLAGDGDRRLSRLDAAPRQLCGVGMAMRPLRASSWISKSPSSVRKRSRRNSPPEISMVSVSRVASTTRA